MPLAGRRRYALSMRFLRLLLAKLDQLRPAFRGGVDGVKDDRPSEPRRFRHDEFESDPSLVMRLAEQDGAALITDDEGKPRMRIGAPIARPLILD
jgi:hypothetical protein